MSVKLAGNRPKTNEVSRSGMTFFPSSELLLDPSPLRVNETLPGQLARSTAREMALQRSRAPRPFVTRARGPGLAGFALAAANEAWNLLLQQNLPIPGGDYMPQGTSELQSYRLSFTLTWKRLLPPPQDIIDQDVSDNILVDGVIILIGISREGGRTEMRQIRFKNGITEKILFTSRGDDFWELQSVDRLEIRPDGQPGTLVPSMPLPLSSGVTDPNAPIALTPQLPGGIPGLLMPTNIPILIPIPGSLAERPIPVVYPLSLPEDLRRALPQMWLTPEGIQVGQGRQGDPIVTTITDTITNIIEQTQLEDLRSRIPPETVTCNADPDPSGDCCDCDDIREIVIEELDSKFPPARPFTLQTVILPVGESNTFILPQFTKFVELRIVEPPPNVKTQTGGDLAPEVSYNGWYSYGVTGETSERTPFHYDFVSIPIPEGVTGFSYTIYAGGTAQATVGYLLPTSN